MRTKRCHFILPAVLVSGIVLASLGPAAAEEPVPEAALVEHLIDIAGISRGVCSVLGCGDGKVALELARAEGFFVHVLDPDTAGVEATRRILDSQGLHGTRAVTERASFSPLPYADNMVDLIVATCLTEDTLGQLQQSEVNRVLRPGGKAILGSTDKAGVSTRQLRAWVEAEVLLFAEVREDAFGRWAVGTKPTPMGMDDWSHWEHAPDNNPVSNDQLIKAPYMTQWLGKPFYIAMPAITTAAGGRIFLATGHIAHHKREEPWLNTLIARNGYNGTILWQRKLPDGYLAHRSAFIATPDVFYMIALDGQGVTMLDPETGEQLDRIQVPGLGGEWKWIAMKDGILYALVGREKDPAESTLVRSQHAHWSWSELSKGYYKQRVPWGFGKTVLAYDVEKKDVVWTHEEDQPVDSRAMSMGDKRLYLYGPDSHIRCLDATCGDIVWTNPDPEVRKLIEEPGRGLGSTPGFKTMCFSVSTPKALFFEAQTRANVVAVSLEDGHFLWHRKKITNNPNMLYLDGKLLVGIGQGGGTLVVDPMTGEKLDDLGFRKRSCARLTATPDSLFCRGMPEGLTRYDRKTGKVLFDGAVRPSCNDGVIGANGLLYMGPWACDCNLSLMGRVALCSAGDFRFDHQATDADRLRKGTGDLARVKPLEVIATDWPTYRADNDRSASTRAPIPSIATSVWRFTPDHPYRPTAPTAAGDLIFLAGDDGKVRAIDARTGRLAWTFITAGPVYKPPTIWNGRAYVGSGDGYIYCLEAATGRLLWRFRASPIERRIMVYGHLASTWPVDSGILVHEGVAYAAAGIIDYNGTHVYALDAKTGNLIWQNNRTGHLDPQLRKGVSAQGSLAVGAGRLWLAGGNIVSPASYDLKTGKYLGPGPGDGSPRSNRGEDIGAFRDNYVLVGGRLRFSAMDNVVNPGRFEAMSIKPGKGTGKVHRLHSGKIPPTWSADRMILIDGRRSIPAAYDAAGIAEYLDHQEAKSPPKPGETWSAKWLDGKSTTSLILGSDAVLAVCETPNYRQLTSQWSVCCSRASDGQRRWEQKLPEAVPPGRLLVDREGRVVVALQSGAVICLGGEKPLKDHISAIVAEAPDSATGRQNAVNLLLNRLGRERDMAVRRFVVDQLREMGTDVAAEARKQGRIADWKLIGPVPWDVENNTTDKVFVDEPNVNLAKAYEVNGKTLKWQDYTCESSLAGINIHQIFGHRRFAAIYAYAEVRLDKDQSLLLKVGSDDGCKVWFNGQLVGKHEGTRGFVPDQNVLKVSGVKGVNSILLKITQGRGDWAFGARLTDPSNRPIDLNGR